MDRQSRSPPPFRSVTSFFTEKDAALAGTIRAAVEEGKPVEACFSRNRSFRKKVRRKGEQAVREQIAGSG